MISLTSIGVRHQSYKWLYQGRSHTIAYETLGQGPSVLLLPAFSTVSSRTELAGIAQILAPHFQVITLDWLGFGESDRPRVHYGRSLYQQLLQDFVQEYCPHPLAIVAAGHGAGYAMQLAQHQPSHCSKLLLVAPTWKGPLRAMGAPIAVASGVRTLVRSPLLGQALYALNTHPAFLKWMYQRHVYVDPDKLTPEFMTVKHQITQQPGARFAPAAFVTGGLDPMSDREEWLRVGRSLSLPVELIIPEQSPPKSNAEMEVLAKLPQIQQHRVPGTLGVYEEYAVDVGHIALAFLQN
ncbi:alpha/beta fold hydrolase [Roseofilum reptotaenium CS-1145]|uniref:Alpha/beta hydrolase n=1 Tax=Roseofilum reptotaenium AO1-A TaxID=1925591 RepID=A0A1L9QRR0_9CYAN|nr:alpha/beta fold hydrolase [Roseofilum reptotaenium]MDB9515619.1 alpha/beta fold hydrolase [Roseofilum reptotaenium CS-1145]OJJ25368.1 alpha/beta hydrolase [Roseofilum reptotaenium AO1-A]